MEKKLDFSFKEHAEQPQKRFKGNSPKFGQVDSLELDESSKPDASKPVDKSQGNESEPTPSREPAYDLASNSPETDELDDWTSDSSQSVYDLCARSSGSASIRSAATRKTTFSRANTKDVELMLNIERGEITRMKTKLKQPTAKELIGQELFKEAANELLNEVFRRLRISLNTKPFPNDGISEAIRSFHFGNILEPINIHFLEQFDIEKEELEFVPEWPIDWQGYSGRMDYAVFRTGQKALEVKQWKQVNKRYFFVVEMKADNALDGLKQAIMYLKKLQEKDNGNLKVSLQTEIPTVILNFFFVAFLNKLTIILIPARPTTPS